MPFRFLKLLAAIAMLGPAMVSFAAAQTGPADSDRAMRGAVTSEAPETLTGKERLGRKWMDEQRIDNCKVPVSKRGSKPRVDTCPDMS
jgi:hypothetical protein